MTNSDVLCLILGGGRGTRLWPLTQSRAKPAVPIGGKYRLIDITVSNSLNSGLHRIAVLTQFNSVSLNRHIAQTYHFDYYHPGWVQILAAEQTAATSDWYQGTADAVRKHLGDIRASEAEDVVILAGDQLYRMDYAAMLAHHRGTQADITVAVKPVGEADVHRFGIVRQASDGRITGFVEKPNVGDLRAELKHGDDPEQPYLASMGIYVFRTPVLMETLDSKSVDFGTHVIPAAIADYRVLGFRFEGYWEDIGTIRSFYDANLALTERNPLFAFHDPVKPIYTRPRFLPGSRIYDVSLDQALLADGCLIEKAEIRHALIGNRSVLQEHVTLRDTIMMGADYYEPRPGHTVPEGPPLGIGRGSCIQGAIIDKNARVGPGVRIEPFPPGTDIDAECWAVRDGIVVVPKNTTIPAGTVIAPR
jgi:glucose-1-phosphate adenylyltransferase